jgi:hypothetical protein
MDPRSRRLEKHRCLEAPKAGSGACLTSPLIEAALLVVLIFHTGQRQGALSFIGTDYVF